MENTEASQRKKYRLNKKKLASAVTTLLLVAGFIAVTGYSLVKAGVISAAAEASALPGAAEAESQNVAQETAGQIIGGTIDGKRIVVDAGHGGFDPGAVGVSGIHESSLNLAVAEYLKTELESSGVEVIMTRETDTGLGNTQTESLHERGSIIEQSGADIVISVHMNFYEKDPDVSGPLVLFMPGSEKGKTLAEAIQQALNDALDTDGASRSQDLYVLRSGSMPCVLVECGYLSNEEEESKLTQSDYQQRIAKAVCDGAAAYFSGE